MTIETANRLYELRKEHNLSQEELAEKLGVSRQAVSKWERSEASPDTDNLIALAKIYGLSLDELVYGKKQEESETVKEEPTGDNEIHVETEDARVTIKSKGIFVKSGDGENVKIGFDGIKINVSDNDGDDDDDDDDEDKEIIEESNDKSKFWRNIPYPIICGVAYLLFGCFNIFGGFAQSWIIFVTIPIYYTLINAIFKKRLCEFAYTVFCAFIYLYLGMYHGNWHPSWIIFVTIPIYYSIAGAIDKRIKSKES